jgi:hypothetical protein
MRIKILAAAGVAIIIAAAAAVIVSCQDGTTAPTAPPKSEAPSQDVVRIWGYVTDPISSPVIGAYVGWWCETCDVWIGDDVVDDIGRYDIDPAPPFNWDDHDGHDLKGMASHPLHYSDYQTIDDFDSTASYQRDFVLIPK